MENRVLSLQQMISVISKYKLGIMSEQFHRLRACFGRKTICGAVLLITELLCVEGELAST